MAELILSPLIETLFAKLASPAFEKLAGYAVIHSEVKKWETSLSQIRALLNDASQKEITNEYIRGWLNRLQHLAYDIDDVLDDLATKVMQRELEEEFQPIKSKSSSSSNRIESVDRASLLQSSPNPIWATASVRPCVVFVGVLSTTVKRPPKAEGNNDGGFKDGDEDSNSNSRQQ